MVSKEAHLKAKLVCQQVKGVTIFVTSKSDCGLYLNSRLYGLMLSVFERLMAWVLTERGLTSVH